MKTSWTDPQRIESLLNGGLAPPLRRLFWRKWRQSPDLRLALFCQKQLLAVVKIYHRKQQKAELEAIGQSLWTDPGKLAWKRQLQEIFESKTGL
jgi:hypothetical protein